MFVDRDDSRRSLRVVLRAAVAVIVIGSATAAGSHAASEAANSKASAVRLAQGFPGGPNVPGIGQPGIPTVPGLPNPNQLPGNRLPEQDLPGKQLPPRNLPDAKLPSSDLPYKQSDEDKQQNEDKERDDADALTRQLTVPTQPRPQTQPRPPFPGTTTRDQPGLVPPEEQPPIGLTPPPPTIFGEELEGENPCCGIVGNQIFYPFTKDPQEYKPVQFATNDGRMVANNVMPHDGGFIETGTDIVLPSVGMDGSVIRTYRSDVKYQAGGLIGDGWDFNWNKRIVPVFTRITGTGLGVETLGAPSALFYYDGTGHADKFDSTHSEQRRVVNFGETYDTQKQFFAWVTTYKSPPHEFLEIERYIVYEATDHPFKEHPDVKDELGESIFYVVRLKDGTRFVFNCRGQVIYVFDKHHNRVEFRYGGPMNPLTHSPMVSDMIDTAKRRWSVKATTIGEAPIATNFDCMFVSGVLPIPRVQEISDPAGRKLVVHYTFTGVPTIDWVTQEFANDVGLSTDYSYDSENRLTDIIPPKEFSGQKRAVVHNDYNGEGRVVSQRHEAQTYSLSYDNGITVTDSSNTRARYELRDLDDTFVIASVTITGGGTSSTTRYAHNPSHQITSETLPRGNRIEYLFDAGNEPVTLGRVRDWADANLTYENNLSLGNLLGVRMVSDRPEARAVFRNGQVAMQSASGGPQEEILEAFSYEPLFNEKELFIDRRSSQTNYTYNYNLDYGHLGVPVRVQPPQATQPGGGKIEVPAQVFTYSERGEPLTVTAGPRTISNTYNQSGWLTRRTREDGASAVTEYRNDGQIISATMPEGYKITYQRNGRGLVETSTLDPGADEVRTRYTYDLHGNVTEMRKDVRDLFPANGAGALGVPPRFFGENVTTYVYDQYDRLTRETFKGYDGVTFGTSKSYDADNRVVSATTPSPAGSGAVTITYTYDALGRKITETAGGRTKRFEYDANGNLTAENASGRSTFYFYDGFDREIATADQAGGLMRKTLDKSGNATEVAFEGETGQQNGRGLLLETKTDFDEYDRPIRISRNTFVNGSVVSESYFDGNHDLVREKGVGGAFTRYEYDAMGRRTLREDPLGNLTRYTYSGGGFLTTIEEVEKDTTFSTPGANPTQTTRTYTTTVVNDKFGNPISRGARGGTPARTGYDSEGNVRVVVDETGRRTVNEYNSRKLLTAVIRDGETSRVAYNPAGLKISADMPGGAMRWTYDQFGNALTATNTVTGQTTRKTYDAFDQMITSTEGGVTLNYRYDTRGRLTEIIDRESYRYDGLGRVVLSGTIGRQYDGLGNVVLERNYFSAAQRGDISVRFEYAPDGTQRTVRVPAIGNAPAATYTWRMDPLGRVTRAEMNGELAASYLYSGANRVARVAYGDFTRAVFAYDGARRPTELQIWSDLARQNLWSGSAGYYGNTLINSRELYSSGTGGRVRSQSMVLTLDARRRPVVKETSLVSRPDSGGMSYQVTTREFTDYDRTGRATKSVSSVFVNDALTAVKSQGFTFAQGRISTTDTRVAEVQNGPGMVNFQRNRADEYLGSPKYTENERFSHDGNGNVVSDDQYAYRYDHRGRLSSVFRRFGDADTDPSMEDAGYSYDNLGRLHAVIQNARNADRYFIYDGDHVIAEYRLVAGNPVLLAQYAYGAGEGEIVRMDKRQDDDPARPFKTYYLHEGLAGGYNFALSDTFRDPQIISRERWRGLSENMIEGTKTRFPYVSRGARYDPFTEFVYDEVGHTYAYDYTRAPVVGWNQRRDEWLAEMQAAAEETKRAQLAIFAIAALPLGPVVPTTAWVGGGVSLGLDYSMTSYVGGEYSFEQGMKAFGLGAIGGGFGAALGAAPGVSGVARFGIEAGFDIATGAVIDAASGNDVSEGLVQNLLLSAVGGVGGKVQAAVAKRFASTPILGADLTRPISLNSTRTITRGLADDPSATGKAADDEDFIFKETAYSKEELKKLSRAISSHLMNSTRIAGLIGGLVRNHKLMIGIGQFVQHPGARGFYMRGDTIYINETLFKKEYGDLLNSPAGIVDLTSSIVHEAVHFLGGGEISAHLAQAQFLDFSLKQNRKLRFLDHGAEWQSNSRALAFAARSNSILPLLEIVGSRGYGLKSPKGLFENTVAGKGRELHPIVKGLGGFEKILGVKDSSLALIKTKMPAGSSF